MRHFTSRSVRRRQQSTTTNSRSTNQPSVPITLSFTTQGSSSSMISLFGRVLAGSPMLHTQITRLNKHKVVFIRKLRAHAFLIFYPTPFVVHELNKTCHALYTCSSGRKNSSFGLPLIMSWLKPLIKCVYQCSLILSRSSCSN